jgi:hypothetical protein
MTRWRTRWKTGWRTNDGVQNVRRDVQMARLHEIISSITRIEGLSQEQYDKIDIAIKLFLELLEGTTTHGPRPRQIPMPREGGSITPIQAHVTRTRLSFGSQKKKRKLNHEEQGIQEEPIVHSPGPSGSKVPKRRQLLSKRSAHEYDYQSCAKKHVQVVEISTYSSRELSTPNAKIANI